MKERLIVDTSVFLTYASFGKIYRLVNAIELYELQVFVNKTLIDELEKNLDRVLAGKTFSPKDILNEIFSCTQLINTIPLFVNCPDEKDNFLFDLALQSGCNILVTKETALLSWAKSPITVYDLKWFKETYPVAL